MLTMFHSTGVNPRTNKQLSSRRHECYCGWKQTRSLFLLPLKGYYFNILSTVTTAQHKNTISYRQTTMKINQNLFLLSVLARDHMRKTIY